MAGEATITNLLLQMFWVKAEIITVNLSSFTIMETILGAELENKVPLAQFCPSQSLSALPLHFHFC